MIAKNDDGEIRAEEILAEAMERIERKRYQTLSLLPSLNIAVEIARMFDGMGEPRITQVLDEHPHVNISFSFAHRGDLVAALRAFSRRGIHRATQPRDIGEFRNYQLTGRIHLDVRPAKSNTTCRLVKIGEQIEPQYKMVCA